jgi:hypothetical protein
VCGLMDSACQLRLLPRTRLCLLASLTLRGGRIADIPVLGVRTNRRAISLRLRRQPINQIGAVRLMEQHRVDGV